VTEDDQTNPEAAVRAARKLIDVDGVIAITGTWASAVTTAVAPLCWENKVVLCTVSGADSITQLPHQGYIFRTQPTGVLQWPAVSRFMHREGGSRLAYMSPQTPFAQSAVDFIGQYARSNNLTFASLIYEDRKTSYRSEVDEIMRARPDFIFMGGYQPDVTVLIRDIFRASYAGKLLAAAYAVNQQVVDAAPAEVTSGIYLYEPWGAVDSGGYRRLQEELTRLWKVDRPALVTTVAWAASNGDRSENGDYIYGKRKLREIDKRIRYISKTLDGATVVDNSGKAQQKVFFGATVTFEHENGEEREVTIVGVDELDSSDARVSWRSPLAKALLTAKVGDTVTLRAPRGPERLEIIAVRYDDLR